MFRYSYRQALFLLLDEPGRNPLECLQLSRRMMQGHIRELLGLDISLLGWYLLTIFPPAMIWTLPYTNVCYAVYYDRRRQAFLAEQPGPAEAADKEEDGEQ